MVFVAMGDDKTFDFALVLDEVGKIRDNIVDSRHGVIREHDTTVDDENRIVIFDAINVLSDFAESSQCVDLNGRCEFFSFSHSNTSNNKYKNTFRVQSNKKTTYLRLLYPFLGQIENEKRRKRFIR